MTKKSPSNLLTIVSRLWREQVRGYFWHMVLIALLLLLSASATSVQPLLVQQAFDKIFKEKDTFYLLWTPFLIVCAFTAQAITLYCSNFMIGRITNSITANMRKRLFTHAIDNEIDFHSRVGSGSLLSRIVSEIGQITIAINAFFNVWCRQLATAVGLFGVMLYQSVELTLLSLIAFAVAFYPLKRITTRLKKLSRQLNDKNGTLNSRLMESFAGIRTVKAFRKEEFEAEKIGDYIDEIKKSSNRQNMISILTVPMLQVLSGLSIAFIIWFGGSQLIEGHMTEGNLVAFIASLMMFNRPMRSLSSSGGSMINGLVAAERYYELLGTKPAFHSRDHGNILKVARGEVVLHDVAFAYPTGTQALNHISFTAEAGKKTALVGHSGSGKSTIFNLLLKFYVPSTGHILIDGQDVHEASINSVRAQIGFVSQDIFIFDETVMNNIGYGREGATEADIIEAAKAAHCHTFIMALPEGYNTKLGFAGESLSGGQKQRIAIARAFLRNAPILLLDEATSALDPKTEGDIQESLDRLSKGRTTIIIAHRLSTVINADHMILLEHGNIVGSGTHESLLKDSLIYRSHFGL